jgi:hypothetical protein
VQGAEKLASTGIRSPDRPFRSESLYQLSYPGPRERTPVSIALASGWAPEPVWAFRRREESYALRGFELRSPARSPADLCMYVCVCPVDVAFPYKLMWGE